MGIYILGIKIVAKKNLSVINKICTLNNYKYIQDITTKRSLHSRNRDHSYINLSKRI